MRILAVSPGTVHSNFVHYQLMLCKALQQQGHDVTIVAPSADKYNDFKRQAVTDIDGVRVIQPFQFATRRLEINLLPYLVTATLRILFTKTDVVFVYKPTPISCLGFMAKLFRRTPVFVAMDDLGAEVMAIEGHPAYMRKLVEWSERLASRWADGLVVASSLLYDMQRAAYPEKPLAYVSNGIDQSWLTKPPRRAPHPKRIVFLGAFNRRNIVEPLFDVMPAIVKKHPDVRVLLIGDGQFLPYFRDRCTTLGLDAYVTFAGWQQLDAAKKLMGKGDIGYCYMPDARTVRAASNNKVPQYMALGVVPLVSRVGDLPQMVDEGRAGYVAKADDPAALQRELLKALADPDRLAKADRARAHAAQRFDWEKLAQGVVPMLQQITGDRS